MYRLLMFLASAGFVATLLGCCLGSFVLAATLSSAQGAPQEASGAAVALCFAVLPYVAARILQEWARSLKEGHDYAEWQGRIAGIEANYRRQRAEEATRGSGR